MKKILIPALLLALVSCKKDRFVDCQYPVDGTYEGYWMSYTVTGDTAFGETNNLKVDFDKGKIEIEYEGSKSQLMEVTNCVAGYSTQVDASDDQYSIVGFNFFEDSLHYTLDQYIGNELNTITHHYLTKQ